MKYILINNNYIIPEKIECDNLNEILINYSKIIFKRELSYLKNLFIIRQVSFVNKLIIFSDNGKEMFIHYNNATYKLCDIFFLNLNLNSNDYYNIEIVYDKEIQKKLENNEEFSTNIQILEENLSEKNNMDLIIKEKKNNIIIDPNNQNNQLNENNINHEINKEENEENKEEKVKIDEKKRAELLEQCESVYKIYQDELTKIKKLETDLNLNKNKLKKLEKKRSDIILNNIKLLQNDYRTWKKIKYVLKDEDDLLKDISELELKDLEDDKEIPIIFQSRYEYFDYLYNQENQSTTKLLIELNNIDLIKYYTENDNSIKESIITLAKNYKDIHKELSYKFSHDWDYLDTEMNMTSTNKL
jgi:hypothetical protein